MKYGSLDYWESGMDLCLSPDRFESFFLYQERLKKEFEWMDSAYGFSVVDANRNPAQVHAEVKRIVAPLYGAPKHRRRGGAGEPREPAEPTSPMPSAASESEASPGLPRPARPPR
jgi:hypothetical protein